MDKKICILFSDGVEEIELTLPVDIFRRCGLNVTLVSAKETKEVTGAHGIKFLADATIEAINIDDFDILILPGGPSSFALNTDESVLSAVKKFFNQKKLICAICAAPLILQNAGVLDGKQFTAHPCTYSALKAAKQDASVVVDNELISAKGPGVAAEFAFAVVEHVCGKDTAKAIKSELFF